jgi:hypothetical protein
MVPYQNQPNQQRRGRGRGRRRKGKSNSGNVLNFQPNVTSALTLTLSGLDTPVPVAGFKATAIKINSLSGTSNLGHYIAKASNFAGIFQYTFVNWLQIEWIPTTGYTTVGTVALGIQPDISATTPADLQAIYSLSHSVVGDLKQPIVLRISGDQLRQSRAYPLTHESGASEEQKSAGVLYTWVDGDTGTTSPGYFKITAQYNYSQFQSS